MPAVKGQFPAYGKQQYLEDKNMVILGREVVTLKPTSVS
jgi:hypothetical protein